VALPLLGGLLGWTLVLAPLFLFSLPFLECFLFIKFGRVSSFKQEKGGFFHKTKESTNNNN
jgi:hypothetical protein